MVPTVGRILLAGVMAVAVAFGTAGAAGAAGTADRQNQPGVQVLPPPDDWPEGGRFTVFLCKDGDSINNCRERAITAEQERALETRLRAMPEVTEVAFESREEALANFRKQNAGNKLLLSAVEVEGMSESFQGRLRRWDDMPSFWSAARKTAGVSNVFVSGDFFWEDKADVTVTLCGPKKTDYACKGRGPATAKERKAIEVRLGAPDESLSLYFENRAHARRVFGYVFGTKTFSSRFPESYFPESYHAKLVDPGRAKTVIDAVKGMAGVYEAAMVGDGRSAPVNVGTR
ncbi:permease-like cell division protein FtsX [Streptosporangium canum]|uniref:permease-like cell division protein FtsX n=1 Tax=Streptosporangium canum TaxID=324952 RepID=UPI0037BC0983